MWVRMTFTCIISTMFLSEFELGPNIVITSFFYLNTLELSCSIMGLAYQSFKISVTLIIYWELPHLLPLRAVGRCLLPRYSPILECPWLAGISICKETCTQDALMVMHVCREPRRWDQNSLDYVHRHALAVVFDHVKVADKCPCNDAECPAK